MRMQTMHLFQVWVKVKNIVNQKNALGGVFCTHLCLKSTMDSSDLAEDEELSENENTDRLWGCF